MASYIENPGPLSAPDFVTAKTPRGLRRAMLRNNIKQKGFVVYEAIQFVDKDGLWYAWFYVKPDPNRSMQSMVEEIDGDN